MQRAGCLLLYAIVACGCLGTGPTPDGNATAGLALRILDWDDHEAEPGEIPRRPRLALAAEGGLDTEDEAISLLRGDADMDLLDDLEGAPLREEHAARAVACDVVADVDGVWLSPRAALAADASYTLAVGAWAMPSRRREANGLPTTFSLHTAKDPDAGASVIGSWPADGSSGVGIDLAETVVYLDGEVRDVDDAVWLEGPDGLAVPGALRSEPCDVGVFGRRSTQCVAIALTGALAPNARYTMRVGTGLRDGRGAPVGPWHAEFSTSAGLDRTRPELLPLACDIDERALAWGCALADDDGLALRLRVTEPSRIELRANDQELRELALGDETELRVTGFGPDTPVLLDLVVRDAAGHEVMHRDMLRTAPPLAALSIVEVRANPRGPEPEQELIELLNYGTTAVNLDGFSLSDRGDEQGAPLAGSVLVHPGARALLVADDFDAANPLDTSPPPGAALVRVGPRLTPGGLANAGEPLYLRDPLGRRVSAAPSMPRPRSGVCTVRVAQDMRRGDNGSFDHAPNDGCSPGR